ncbi:hypothetical protein LTR94_025269, partial [Friedmanniomyces endolithicus]
MTDTTTPSLSSVKSRGSRLNDRRRWPRKALRFASSAMVISTWLSGAIFAFYIIAFFGGTAVQGAAQRWNESLPGLHDFAAPVATIAI